MSTLQNLENTRQEIKDRRKLKKVNLYFSQFFFKANVTHNKDFNIIGKMKTHENISQGLHRKQI